VHCGEEEAVAPHHRINRGMGGSKARNHPANILVLCSVVNGLIESDASWAAAARAWGWKARQFEDAGKVPVWYPLEGVWFILNDDYEREPIANHPKEPGV